jgi:hypothetical protein
LADWVASLYGVSGIQEAKGREGNHVNRSTLRMVMTILMYAGVGVFLLPYVIGKASTGPLLMLVGGLMSVICGLLRCCLMDRE